MRVCAAQFSPESGDVDQNLLHHMRLAQLAAEQQIDLVFFSELSLTGYEPRLASKLAIQPDDPRLDALQALATNRQLIIGLGLPTKSNAGIRISMLWLHPNREAQLYSKQMLHEDELSYFVPGNHDLLLSCDKHRLACAICYESLCESHAARSSELGADFYLASVAKHQQGLGRAHQHYPEIAQRYGMRILMANAYGPCEGFAACGRSAVWDQRGVLLDELGPDEQGIIGFDTQSGAPIRAGLIPPQ